MTSAISDDGVIGYPPKNRHPAASAPYASETLPCQNSTLGIVATLLYGDGKIGANILALFASNTILGSCWSGFQVLVKIKYLFGANSHTQAAPLAPMGVYVNRKYFRQTTHLPFRTIISLWKYYLPSKYYATL